MTDRELIELAAKANWESEIDEVSMRWCDSDQCVLYIHADNQDHNGVDREFRWNPLEDDGDALRLAVKLDIHISLYGRDAGMNTWVIDGEAETFDSDYGDDPCAAVRRLIVRAAAFIGAKLP